MKPAHPQALLLVADDDPDDQYFFQEAMQVACPESAEIHFAYDGDRLLRFLQTTDIDRYLRSLVVLDLNMQVKDGQATLLALKSNPAYADIPVVILTTSSSPEDMKYCEAHGAAGYYQKPHSIVELVEIVRRMYLEYLAE